MILLTLQENKSHLDKTNCYKYQGKFRNDIDTDYRLLSLHKQVERCGT